MHPTSVGPDGVPPTDIWDGPSASICLDLKQVIAVTSLLSHLKSPRSDFKFLFSDLNFFFPFLTYEKLCLDNIPTNAYAEHEKFWVRVLLPLIGKGPQSVVDKNFTMNIKVTERHSSYAVMRDFVKVT